MEIEACRDFLNVFKYPELPKLFSVYHLSLDIESKEKKEYGPPQEHYAAWAHCGRWRTDEQPRRRYGRSLYLLLDAGLSNRTTKKGIDFILDVLDKRLEKVSQTLPPYKITHGHYINFKRLDYGIAKEASEILIESAEEIEKKLDANLTKGIFGINRTSDYKLTRFDASFEPTHILNDGSIPNEDVKSAVDWLIENKLISEHQIYYDEKENKFLIPNPTIK